MIRRQASWVVASGFSQNTGLPASIAASTYSSWVGPQEQTTMASTVVGLDQFLTGRVGQRAGDPVGDPLGLVEIDVGDRGDPGTGEHRGQPADVVLADHADADHSDVDCHV